MTVDTVEDGAGRPETATAVQRAWAEARRVPPHPRRFSAAGLPPPNWPCTRSCGASIAPTSRRRCTCARSPKRRRRARRCSSAWGRTPAWSMSATGWAVTFKIESHNHPSYVEPYQGAATGVGGIVRDILTMGARPVAVMDSLRFGPADARRHRPGVARRGRGHRRIRKLSRLAEHRRRGRSSTGRISVTRWSMRCASASCAADGIKLARATGVGNRVILFGARTGRDGIGGVSVLASATFDEGERQAAECSGWRPVRREGPHRVLPGDLRRRSGRRHPGPRRRRVVVRHHGARQRG